MHSHKRQQFKNRLEVMAPALRAGITDASGQTEVVKLDGTMGRLSRMDALQWQARMRALPKQRQEQPWICVDNALRRIAAGGYSKCGRSNGAVS